MVQLLPSFDRLSLHFPSPSCTSPSFLSVPIIKPPPSIASLPPELLIIIFDHAVDRCSRQARGPTKAAQFQAARSLLSRLSLVCRVWTDPARSRLYRHIIFDSNEMVTKWISSGSDGRYATIILEFEPWMGSGRQFGTPVRQTQIVKAIAKVRGIKELIIGDVGGERDPDLLHDETLTGTIHVTLLISSRFADTRVLDEQDLQLLTLRFATFKWSKMHYPLPTHLTTFVAPQSQSPGSAQITGDIIHASAHSLVDLTLYFHNPDSGAHRQWIEPLQLVAPFLVRLRLHGVIHQEDETTPIPLSVLHTLAQCRRLRSIEVCSPPSELHLALPLLPSPLQSLKVHWRISPYYEQRLPALTGEQLEEIFACNAFKELTELETFHGGTSVEDLTMLRSHGIEWIGGVS